MSYPRVACYSGNKGFGWPLTLENRPGSPLNVALLEKLARYSTITVNVSPWYSIAEACRPDALLVLRQANPSIRILSYQLLGWHYLGPDFTVASWDKTFAGSWHTAIKESGGFGNPSGEKGWMVRWENPETEAALTKLLCDCAGSRLFDGHFYDFASGVSTAAQHGMERAVQAVRQAGGPGFTIHGNGWYADALNLDGSFREGFPDHLTTFEQARKWRAGRPHRTQDWLQAGTGYTSLDTPDAQRAARFAHGTACLFDCMCSFGPDRDLGPNPRYHTWYMPEYDGGGRGAGWLCGPTSVADLYYERTWRRRFGGGLVLVNPSAQDENVSVSRGLCRLDGTEMGTVTVPAKDAVFLARAR